MDNLSSQEKDILHRCLKACLDESFFANEEFQTLTGYTKTDVQNLLNVWPKIDIDDEPTRNLILNILNNLTGYPHDAGQEKWDDAIGASPEKLKQIWAKINIASTVDEVYRKHIWDKLTEPLADAAKQELKAELSKEHELYGIDVVALARRPDKDDVLFKLLDGSRRVAEVHLTYSGKTEEPQFLKSKIYPSLEDWSTNALQEDKKSSS